MAEPNSRLWGGLPPQKPGDGTKNESALSIFSGRSSGQSRAEPPGKAVNQKAHVPGKSPKRARRPQFTVRRRHSECCCREFGISRVTGHRIFNRYRECGLDALNGRNCAPYRQGLARLNAELMDKYVEQVRLFGYTVDELAGDDDKLWTCFEAWQQHNNASTPACRTSLL